MSKFKIKKRFLGLKGPYAERANYLWRLLREREKSAFRGLAGDFKKERCLDVGAGSGAYAQILLEMGAKKIDCLDFSPPLLSEIKGKGINKILADAESFKTEEKYDLILCLGILEFLDEPKKFAERLKRFLRPEAKIIILLPQFKIAGLFYALIYLLKGIFIHPLTLNELGAYLTKKGFVLEQKAACGFFSALGAFAVSPEAAALGKTRE